MRVRILMIAILSFVFVGFSYLDTEKEAREHIKNIKEGVLLVRLHTQDALIAKMKYYHQDVARKKKIEEIYQKNKSAYAALSSAYTFGEIRFFFGRNSEQVRNGEFDGIFLNQGLEIDSNIQIPPNVPIYVLDVGDIYFPHMSGHQEGVIVMNQNFEPLQKPFPYYVRRRSGMVILKRTDLDIAILLNNRFESFYKKFFME